MEPILPGTHGMHHASVIHAEETIEVEGESAAGDRQEATPVDAAAQSNRWRLVKGQGILAVVFLIVAGSPGMVAGSAPSGFLKVSGDTLITASGKPFLLRGFNVEFKDFKTVLGEQDIRRIAETGATCIRLVLDYRDLVIAPSRYREENFSLLDTILAWCEKHGVYVILDMHLAPGIQNLHDFVVHRETTAAFWLKDEHQERFYGLWTEIARRYAARTIVAGYDLLNEGTPPDVGLYRKILTSVAQKIRSRDTNHILIVEEAILPDRNKELVLIGDKNTLYSIHFFYPPQFTFYATTTERTITTYPGEMASAGSGVGETAVALGPGTGEWTSVTVRGAPPGGAEVFLVRISAEGNRGTLWVDDVSLDINGQRVDLPAPLVSNGSFEIDYPGFMWTTNGACVRRTDEKAKAGRVSLAFSDCASPGSAVSSPLQVVNGEYVLTAWYASAGRPGKTRLSLSWHRKKVLSTLRKSALLEKIDYALRFKALHKVPVYVGEFTAHANPSPESVSNYLQDLLDIMNSAGLHWSFWEYYSVYPGVGLYTGNTPRLVNPAAWDALKRHMRPGW